MNQQCHISWSGVSSSSFSVSNGVRQGSVASPTFFNSYIDDLFEELRQSGFGCYIDELFMGSVAYADDIGLLAPSREALQGMITIAHNFFNKLGIEISTDPDVKKTKTEVLYVGDGPSPVPVHLGVKPLPYVYSWEHLGHLVCDDENTFADLQEKRRVIVARFHSL